MNHFDARFTWWPDILAYKPNNYPVYTSLSDIPCTERN